MRVSKLALLFTSGIVFFAVLNAVSLYRSTSECECCTVAPVGLPMTWALRGGLQAEHFRFVWRGLVVDVAAAICLSYLFARVVLFLKPPASPLPSPSAAPQ